MIKSELCFAITFYHVDILYIGLNSPSLIGAYIYTFSNEMNYENVGWKRMFENIFKFFK